MLGTALRSVAASVVALLPSVIALVVLRDRWHGSLVREAVLVLGSVLVAIGLGWWTMRALKLAELPALETLVGSVLGRRRQR